MVYFVVKIFMGGKKSISQQSWNQKVSWMPFAARLTVKKALVMH